MCKLENYDFNITETEKSVNTFYSNKHLRPTFIVGLTV